MSLPNYIQMCRLGSPLCTDITEGTQDQRYQMGCKYPLSVFDPGGLGRAVQRAGWTGVCPHCFPLLPALLSALLL